MLLMRVLLLPLAFLTVFSSSPFPAQAQQDRPAPSTPAASSAVTADTEPGKQENPEQENGIAAPETLYVNPEVEDRLVILTILEYPPGSQLVNPSPFDQSSICH